MRWLILLISVILFAVTDIDVLLWQFTVFRNFYVESESKGATVDHSESKNIESMLFVFR